MRILHQEGARTTHDVDKQVQLVGFRRGNPRARIARGVGVRGSHRTN